jgi:dolichol-phosphate mannosyltransferase
MKDGERYRNSRDIRLRECGAARAIARSGADRYPSPARTWKSVPHRRSREPSAIPIPPPTMVQHSPQAASGDGAPGSSGSEMRTPSDPPCHPTAARVVCTLPTYNESRNILPLVRDLLALGPSFQVIVIDDDSPDGTWRIVGEAAQHEPRLRLLHRTRDKGRGNAGREGFVEALKMGASIVVEMDADFSHQPRFVPALIARLEEGPGPVGLVLGSRAVEGGLDADRGLTRRMITKAANLYIRVLLGVSVRDCNSGFRCWKRETLERINVREAFSPGPAIVQELLFKTARAGIGIAEVPIEFSNRLHGQSTLTVRTLLSGYTAVLKLRWMSLCGRL